MENTGDKDDSTLSFSSMIQQGQDQPNISPDPRQIPRETPFNFRRAISLSSSPTNVLLSTGQLIPSSFPMSKTDSCTGSTTSRSDSTNSSTSGGGEERKKCLRESNGGRRAQDGVMAVPKRVRFQESPIAPRGSEKAKNCSATPPAWRSKKKVEKQRGLFGMFLVVCRECHALEPSKHVADKIVAV